jgi:hypothetical protein
MHDFLGNHLQNAGLMAMNEQMLASQEMDAKCAGSLMLPGD